MDRYSVELISLECGFDWSTLAHVHVRPSRCASRENNIIARNLFFFFLF